MFHAIYLLPGFHQNVFREAQPPKTSVCALCTANRRLAAFRNDDQQVNIAVVVWRTPGVRTVQENLVRLELSLESLDGRVQQMLGNRLHGRENSMCH